MRRNTAIWIALGSIPVPNFIYSGVNIHIGAMSALLLLSTATARAEQRWFNPSLLEAGRGNTVDYKALERLANGQQLPGTYTVDVYINESFISRQDTVFSADGPGGTLTPSWTVNSLLSMGVKKDALAANGKLDMKEDTEARLIPGILNYIAGSRAHFDLGRQRLDVTIPEIFFNRPLYGATDYRLWDDGLTAGIVDYNFSVWKTVARQNGSQDRDNSFVSLNNSLNIGAWRAHNFSTWSYDNQSVNTESLGKTQRWQAINTWLDRPVPYAKGLLSIGDRYTSPDVFDSVQFRGIQLATDEDMYPDLLRLFAPVIRGTAGSNARVTVRQNGTVIYETTVAPGPFAITDLPLSSHSGDLYVTVQEANGALHTSVQGSSSLAIMQREEQLRYSLTAGKLRSSGNSTREPSFLQGTAIYGLPYGLTSYGGVLAADDYNAGSLGLGSTLGVVGALSADITMAKSAISKKMNTGSTEDSVGQSWRIRYSKAVEETSTTISLAANRYSTRGYYSFADANNLPDKRRDNTAVTQDGFITTQVVNARKREEMQIDLNQSLGTTLGSVGLNATRKTFWDMDGEQQSVSANWSWTLKSVGLGVGWQFTSWPGSTKKDDRLVSLMVTLPLSQWLYSPDTRNTLYSTTTLARYNTGRDSFSNTLGGTFLEDNRLALSAMQTKVRSGRNRNDNDGENRTSLNTGYIGRAGKISAGYSNSRDTHQINAALQGAIVATKYGLTAGQSSGETIGLIHVPDAPGIRVRSGIGIETDELGNALVAAQPYRRNRYDLDVISASPNVTLIDSSREVIPSRGAVVAAVYENTVGHQVLMTLTRSGRPLPFGSIVTLSRSGAESSHIGGRANPVGIVGDDGQVWLTGMPDRGTLLVTWSEGLEGTCRVVFSLSEDVTRKAEQNLPIAANGECL